MRGYPKYIKRDHYIDSEAYCYSGRNSNRFLYWRTDINNDIIFLPNNDRLP